MLPNALVVLLLWRLEDLRGRDMMVTLVCAAMAISG